MIIFGLGPIEQTCESNESSSNKLDSMEQKQKIERSPVRSTEEVEVGAVPGGSD